MQRINDTNSWFFEKTSKKAETIQIKKIRNQKGNMARDTEESQRIIKTYFKNLYSK